MRRASLIIAACLAAACAEEPRPPSVQQFVDDSILLEAAMVRCSANRVQSRYEAECVNAREAVKIIAAREEKERQAEMEALSEKKRRALRRTLDAAAEARKRAAERERLRREAEYLAQFGELPPPDLQDGASTDAAAESGNAPGVVVPATAGDDVEAAGTAGTPMPAPVDGGNAPGLTVTPEEPAQSDLSQIREELRNRQQSDQ